MTDNEQTIKSLNDKLNTAVNQYNEVVKQNASLQSELNEYKKLKDEALEPPLSLREVLLMNCVESDVSSRYENDIKKRIVEFLKEMSSQDNRGTAFPYIYTIADEYEHFEPNSGGDFFFDSCRDEVLKVFDILSENYIEGNIEIDSEENFDDILESLGTPYEDERIDEWLRNYGGKTVQRYSKEYETYYEGTFFTESDAKEYLASTLNHHFGPNPRTYVDSMNKWGRHSKTEAFLVDLFKYFDVKIPPKMYYDKKKEGGEC